MFNETHTSKVARASGHSRIASAAAVCLVVVAVVAGAVSTARADPTAVWDSEVPARNAVLTVPPKPVSVHVNCSAALLDATRRVTIDGVVQGSSIKHNLPQPQGGKDPRDAVISVSVPTGGSSDGTHTINVAIKNTVGTTVTTGWDYKIAIPPTIGTPVPGNGSTVTTSNPEISVPVSDNTLVATWTVTINGQVVSAVLASGRLRALPSAPLIDDAVTTVTATVFDGIGLSASRTWAFTVQTRPEMVDMVSACARCHPAQAAPEHSYNTDCDECHGQWAVAAHSGTPSSYHKSADVSGCRPCHNSSLTIEHASGTLDCLTCHESTRPEVVAAISGGNSACTACHGSITHPGADAAHEDAFSLCEGSTCHTGPLTALHTTSQCATCHGIGKSTNCATVGCHDTKIDGNGDVIPHGFDPALHIGNDTAGPDARPLGCSDRLGQQDGCHDITNVAALHAGVAGGPCGVCHGAGKTPSLNCRSCHPAGYSNPGPGVLGGGMLYHHFNVVYLNNRSDAPFSAYYLWDPTKPYHQQPMPAGGWNDALETQDCMEHCHKGIVGPGSPPYAGSKMFYSLSSADPYPLAQSPARALTRSVTLPNQATTLTFKTKWALEYYREVWNDTLGQYEYHVTATDSAVVQVSTDGGASWTPLAGDMGGAGNPVTGASSGGWKDATFDLSAYAGQTIKLRFLYAPVWPAQYPDIAADGWAVDDIAITGASGTVFSDGAEALDPGWTGGWQRVGATYGF